MTREVKAELFSLQNWHNLSPGPFPCHPPLMLPHPKCIPPPQNMDGVGSPTTQNSWTTLSKQERLGVRTYLKRNLLFVLALSQIWSDTKSPESKAEPTHLQGSLGPAHHEN